jgi:hypothetical protein
MAFKPADSFVGAQPLTTVDDTAKHILGSRIKAVDVSLGEGEFIYLEGVADTAAGLVVGYNEAFETVLADAGDRGPVAVAMAAVVADKYGWYQIKGIATVKVLAADAADKPQFLTATDGSVDDAVVTGDQLDGFVSMSAIDTPAAGYAYCYLSYPCANGNGDSDG